VTLGSDYCSTWASTIPWRGPAPAAQPKEKGLIAGGNARGYFACERSQLAGSIAASAAPSPSRAARSKQSSARCVTGSSRPSARASRAWCAGPCGSSRR